ncbi:unnamed protein product [Zymoseptoria tritici ST99CH_3D7]|uniref:Uncharacterized protein n=1 Tax=Zymoseptoria tritici (strain ST99CH_3D7) TaxID=1276538 RepID=A0A1X7S347_ZYMT9|nr:unnamed protein product [Zymoseptoria tritici ST99CH_3D7]
MTASPTASTTTASTIASTSTSTTASTTTASPTVSTTASTTTASTTTASPTASTTTASTTASTSTPNTINPTCATFFLQAIEDGSFLSASVDGNNIVSTADSSAATRYRIDGNQLIDASTSSIWSKNSGTTIDAVKTQDSLPATEIAITCEFLPETANTLSCEDPTNTAVNKLGFCASLDNSLALADGGADCTFYNYRAVCETSPFTPPFLISATDPATGSFLGYITAAYFSFGIRDLTTTASEALQVTYDPSSGETGHPSQLTITSLNSADYQDLTLLSILAFVQTSEDNPPQDMRSGSNNYGFLGNSQSTPRGQTSQDVDSSIQRATGVVLPSQTAIWTVNGLTHELSALWINTPDVPPATLVAILNSNGGNGVYFTGDAEALSARFPGETWQRLTLRLVSVGETVVG